MKTYIVILNWNSWPDTIECLESILKSTYKDFQVVIVDNDSRDNSIFYIKEYLNQNLLPFISPKNPLRNLIIPPFSKKIPYIIYSEDEAIAGGDLEKEEKIKVPQEIKYPVIIIRNRGNYGFAKGNNTALKFILRRNDYKYVWLLNNDVVVEPNSLLNLIKRANEDAKIGFVGSVIRYYNNPNLIQAVGGGKFYSKLGLGKLYMKGNVISILDGLDIDSVDKNIDYIMGASLLIKREVLENIGIFDERFFLYAEELDLITRGKKRGWKIAIALDSYIYHKDSLSTKNKKWLYFYLLNKSNMLFLKKHFGLRYNIIALPFVILNAIKSTRDLKNLKAAIKGVIDGLRY